MIEPYYQDKYCTIYHEDCLRMLADLDREFDAIVTDPPYGIKWNKRQASYMSINSWDDIQNDTHADAERLIAPWICLFNKEKVFFGASNYPAILPHRGRWLCWDKRLNEENDALPGSPFELAWVDSVSGYYRMYRMRHGGVVNANSMKGNNERRHHPTEKPVLLMKAVIHDLIKGKTILDPFMGSGTTLLAARSLGRKAIGIEIEERYCEIAANRLRKIPDKGLWDTPSAPVTDSLA